MEAETARKRKSRASKRTRTGKASRLPEDVLDECEASFTAAQESVTKASKNYYSETGLMALLCRHDKVIYVVNLTTPGERQHNALALLDRLMDELPDTWRVGVLYDIACQLSRSVDKHNFLERFSDRLIWAVSVFHAYGHQWACQLLFHPRKCDGFGLSDGEGCERFWSSIRHLISVLRVTGYHRRLFMLDRQMTYNEQASRCTYGQWLARRYQHTVRRAAQASDVLRTCAVAEEDLAKEWSAQLEAQLTKPERQSASAGDKKLNAILLDIAIREELNTELKSDRAKLKRSARTMQPRDVQELSDRIDGTKRQLDVLRTKIKDESAKLGTRDLGRLQDLRGSAYVRARVNARALRGNIRAAIAAHKFERTKLERTYRHQDGAHNLTENKDHVQTKKLVNRREKTISGMIKKFNQLVTQMEALIKSGQVPKRGTRPPRRLEARKLFKLDVDDDIWQEDPGLGPQDESALPRWQVDDRVRSGIAAMLESRRCEEEMERLAEEAKALNQWYTEEYQTLTNFCAAQEGTLEIILRSGFIDSSTQKTKLSTMQAVRGWPRSMQRQRAGCSTCAGRLSDEAYILRPGR
ncbi:hypothetical protein AURDEDRAFT_62941 [Auricularia subglabra TFB-10046 SS5]|nr:hypothetical protein AURDEDRAFT_62941 [Auricularia subglabra TFB-10046 SS5]